MTPFPEALLDDPEAEVETPFYRWLCSDAGPDDWDRFVLGVNWDMHEPEVFEWIAAQPDCDRATALTLFWKASPDFVIERPDEPCEQGPLIAQIRERWQAGGYARAELAFDPQVDAWPQDFEKLHGAIGPRIDEEWPPSMRQALPGRRVNIDGDIEGIPSRSWPEELR